MFFRCFVRSLCVSVCFTVSVYAAENNPDTYTVNVGNFSKQYPIQPAPGNDKVKIVHITDFVDNNELNKECAASISHILQKNVFAPSKIQSKDVVLLLAGDKANQFGTYLKELLGAKDLVIVRSSNKGNDAVFQVDYSSITSPGTKVLYLRKDQKERLQGASVVIIDDVLSSGGTIEAVTEIADHVGSPVLGYAVMATEGEKRDTFNEKPLINLFHLPVFVS